MPFKTTPKFSNSKHLEIALFTVICALTLWIYWPAMYGPFLFDDVVNLNALQFDGGISDFSSWINFILSGQGSFLGRPLALATFTLNAQTWPADPYPFKITNILIHIFNAWLVAHFLKTLSQIHQRNTTQKISKYLPVIAAAIWLLHPLHLTTVLQVVQRMTLLSGTFTLLCLIGYVRYLDNNTISLNKNFLSVIFYLSIVGFLGVLSKETAIVTTLFIFALNYTLFRKQLEKSPSFAKVWQFSLLGGTLLVFLAGTYFIRGFSWHYSGVDVIERLLTESRILFQYLYTMFLPRANGLGLFHDDITISTTLFSPVTTIISILGIGILIGVAIKVKENLPFLSLAILWFFLGHLFESTIWPLELYFEHRNYLPLLSLIFLIIQLDIVLSSKPKILIYSSTSIYLFLVSFVSGITTPIWGDKLTLFTTWAEENPKSIRAQHSAANEWLYGRNDVNSARIFLATGFRNNQDSLTMRLELIDSNCYFEEVQDDLSFLIEGIEKTKHDEFYLRILSGLVNKKQNNQCQSIDINTIIQILSKLQANTQIMSLTGSWIYYHKAKAHLIQGDLEKSLLNAKASFQRSNYLGALILQLEIAYKMNRLELANEKLKAIQILQKEQPNQKISNSMKYSFEKYKALVEITE